MANRSKKVVLSARIDASVKAALELAAASKDEKIVAFLEYCIQSGLSMLAVFNPFSQDPGRKMPFNMFFDCIWSEDEMLYKLRAGALGPDYATSEMIEIALVVTTGEYFKGDFDLFGDLNGLADAHEMSAPKIFIDLEKVRSEWEQIVSYSEFLKNNPKHRPTYEMFKEFTTTK